MVSASRCRGSQSVNRVPALPDSQLTLAPMACARCCWLRKPRPCRRRASSTAKPSPLSSITTHTPSSVVSVLKQMVDQFHDWRASIIAVQEVPAEHTRRYGIVAGTQVNDRVMDVTRIVEKPAPEAAPSRLGVAGRYILTPGVFHEIANQPRGVGGEIQLTDGIAAMMKKEADYAYA